MFKHLLRERDEDSALLAAGIMSHGREIDLDRNIALEAAQISHELHLAMVDSIILATARAKNTTLWTQDAHYKGIQGVKYVEKKI